MNRDQIDFLLADTRDPDPRTRRRAVRELCPCAAQANVAPIWDRLLALHTDPDVSVRSLVLHALCDGSPAAREHEVVAVVAAMQQDPDVRLRRRARGVLAAWRRTGKIDQL